MLLYSWFWLLFLLTTLIYKHLLIIYWFYFFMKKLPKIIISKSSSYLITKEVSRRDNLISFYCISLFKNIEVWEWLWFNIAMKTLSIFSFHLLIFSKFFTIKAMERDGSDDTFEIISRWGFKKWGFQEKLKVCTTRLSFWFSAFFRSKFWLEHGFFSKNTFWVQNKFRSKFFNGKVVIFQIFFNFAEFYGFFSPVTYFWFKFNNQQNQFWSQSM